MERRSIKVLVIEDDKDEVTKISDYLEFCPDIKFAGATGTSDEGIAMTKELHPDAVVLDLELEEGDGLYYLNAWRAGELHCDPVVLVLTNSHSSHTLEAAHRRGVDRIFHKWKDDYSNNGPRILVEYIRELSPGSSKRGKLSEADELKGDIECALVRLGERLKIPMGSKTLAYLVEAIYIVSRMKVGPVNLSQEVYPLICKKYNTVPKNVYRGIKFCVDKLYSAVERKELEEYYPFEMNETTNAPEVKQFILCMAKRFRNR